MCENQMKTPNVWLVKQKLFKIRDNTLQNDEVDRVWEVEINTADLF